MVNLKPISSLTKPEESQINKNTNNEEDFMDNIEVSENWTFEELNQLQKSLRLIPAGTKDRYHCVHKDLIKYGAKKNRKQLESKIREFQEILKSGGNLIEMIRKSAQKTEEIKEENDKNASVLNKLEEKDKDKMQWTAEEINLLKEGLKKFSDIKDPKEKFQTIAQHIKTKT